MLIPYADDHARLYTLLTKEEHEALLQSKYDGKGERRTNYQTVIGVLKRCVNSLFKPYVHEIVEVDWVSMYLIAQPISSSFAEERRPGLYSRRRLPYALSQSCPGHEC